MKKNFLAVLIIVVSIIAVTSITFVGCNKGDKNTPSGTEITSSGRIVETSSGKKPNSSKDNSSNAGTSSISSASASSQGGATASSGGGTTSSGSQEVSSDRDVTTEYSY